MEHQLTNLAQSTSTSINPDTHIGLVSLRVANLERSLAFYEGILGFRHVEGENTAGTAILGAQDGVPLLELREVPGTPPQSRRSTGMYHAAILLPSRADLGRALMRMVQAGLEIGQGDHLVSEALYISDPDENGLEIYRDRPRDTWRWADGAVKMASDPIDLHGLMDEGKNATWDTLPAGTSVGHIHLKVGDIPQAEHFYHTILGFDITAQMPSALFVGAGGYHHHIGMNTWESKGAGPAPQDTAGLQSFVIALPSREALGEVRTRLAANNVPVQERENGINVADPWGNPVQLVVE
jgi:catechol 2,3-dioxygenase